MRYSYEIKDEAAFFAAIPDVAIAPDMRKLAEHILDSKAATFDPSRFRDRYEEAVVAMLETKQAGAPQLKHAPAATAGNVVDLMDALKRSLAGTPKPAEKLKPKKPSKRIAGQGEMLLPIEGKASKAAAKGKAPVAVPVKGARQGSGRKAG